MLVIKSSEGLRGLCRSVSVLRAYAAAASATMGDMSPAQREVVALVVGDAVLAPKVDGIRRLPAIEDGDGWPSVRELQEQVRAPGAVLLGPPRRYAGEPIVTFHVLTQATEVPTDHGADAWLPLDRIEGLADEAQVRADLIVTLKEADGTTSWPEHRPDWLRRGWVDEAEEWIDAQLDEQGRRRAGPSTVLQMWSLATVLRTPVSDAKGQESAVVFKASCGWFAAEPVITRSVGDLGQNCVPTVLAVEESRAWMLMEEMHGVHGDLENEDARLALALDVAPRIARLQLASLSRLDALRAVGIPDRGRDATIDAFSRLLDDSLELPELTDAELEALRRREPWLREQLTAFYATGIPVALAHGDLHLDNVAADRNGPVAYDWSDASISHPFIDGFHLATRIRQEDRAAVHAAYTTLWAEAFPAADVAGAMRLARLADRIFEAISYEHIQRHQEDASRWELSGVTARILRDVGSMSVD
jgi:Phosphotransferase enzyme family